MDIATEYSLREKSRNFKLRKPHIPGKSPKGISHNEPDPAKPCSVNCNKSHFPEFPGKSRIRKF